MKNIAIFASGKGSNADNICAYFAHHPAIKIKLIVSDRKMAGVFDVAKKHAIEALYINKEGWQHPRELVIELQKRNIDFVVLAGFLKLIPVELIHAFDRKMINIHPALLPRYGGKGMFGMHVHQAVHDAKENETGISIHYVNENYDDGDIIYQAVTSIIPGTSPQQIAASIHQLEMEHFPKVIEEIVLNNKNT